MGHMSKKEWQRECGASLPKPAFYHLFSAEERETLPETHVHTLVWGAVPRENQELSQDRGMG